MCCICLCLCALKIDISKILSNSTENWIFLVHKVLCGWLVESTRLQTAQANSLSPTKSFLKRWSRQGGGKIQIQTRPASFKSVRVLFLMYVVALSRLVTSFLTVMVDGWEGIRGEKREGIAVRVNGESGKSWTVAESRKLSPTSHSPTGSPTPEDRRQVALHR